MTLYEELEWRGLIKDKTNNEDFIEKINKGGMTFYWGTDPSADSLHIGHYSSLITVKRLAMAGHHPILLIGGATGMIGDPRPNAERDILPKELIESNAKKLAKQVKGIVGGDVEERLFGKGRDLLQGFLLLGSGFSGLLSGILGSHLGVFFLLFGLFVLAASRKQRHGADAAEDG